MAVYEFTCNEHGKFSVQRSIQEGPPRLYPCPICKSDTTRVFEARPVIFHSQGFHKTDYDKHGDKLERANKAYEKEYGEKPPPPAKDVPRNSSDPF